MIRLGAKRGLVSELVDFQLRDQMSRLVTRRVRGDRVWDRVRCEVKNQVLQEQVLRPIWKQVREGCPNETRQ